ncbi:hypothetical protein [Microbacterium sp. CIAB417]|uniref:hypothetical protein n=1 Tax=Microbacterium sp. CIAB417 TaxID=2860287 RepID=UPI001FACB534|nr:hypothetical protein [Microbacterium sp. CIAB417]
MSGTRAIPEEELPFPPERREERDPENTDPADAEAMPGGVEQPDTQGTDPLDAEIGEEGQGDLSPEDEPDVLAADADRADAEPTDLRDEAP